MNSIVIDKFIIESTYHFIQVNGLEIHEKMGEHAKLIMSAYTEEEDITVALQAEDEWICVRESGEGKGKILFGGFIRKNCMERRGGINHMVFTAYSADERMDRQKAGASFQDMEMTHERLIRQVVEKYQGAIINNMESRGIGKPYIQYGETDWEFCRRVAGALGAEIFCCPIGCVPLLYIGLPENGDIFDVSADTYRTGIEGKVLPTDSQTTKKDHVFYEISCSENYLIGSRVRFQGRMGYIYEKRVMLKGGSFEFTYKFAGKKCELSCTKYNRYLAGLGLPGTVIRTERGQVFMRLDMDGDREQILYPFPWEPFTVNGMYCMPEPGTRAYLYVPGFEEAEAIGICNIRTRQEKYGDMEDYSQRSLGTEERKRMELYSGHLRMGSNAAANPSLILDDESGLRMTNRKRFSALAGGKIQISARKVTISAPQQISQIKTTRHVDRLEKEISVARGRNPATGGDTEASLVIEQEINALAEQGVLCGTVFELYHAFQDVPGYEELGFWETKWNQVGEFFEVAEGFTGAATDAAKISETDVMATACIPALNCVAAAAGEGDGSGINGDFLAAGIADCVKTGASGGVIYF